MVPYFTDPKEDDKDKNPDGSFKVSGASPSFDASGGQAAPAGAPAKHEDTGSHFANLDKYVAANKGSGFGNQVVGKVQGDVDQAGQSMQGAANSFSGKVNAAPIYGQQQVDAALADPSKADKSQFQAGLSQEYKGPKSLADSQDDYNKFYGNTNKAQTAANELSTEGGRFALLDNYFGRNNYGFGQKSLDNALFQGTEGIGAKSNAVQGQANGLQAQGKQMQDQLQSQASQKAGEIEKARNYEHQALGIDNNNKIVDGQGAYGGLQNELATGLTARNAERATKQAGLADAFSHGTDAGYDLSDDQLKELGLTAGQSTYGFDPRNYINSSALNMDQYASDAQRAKLNALNGLVGEGYQQNILGDKQAATSDYGFDKDRYLADIGGYEQTQASDLANATTNAASTRAALDAAAQQYSGSGNDNQARERRAATDAAAASAQQAEEARRALVAKQAESRKKTIY